MFSLQDAFGTVPEEAAAAAATDFATQLNVAAAQAAYADIEREALEAGSSPEKLDAFLEKLVEGCQSPCPSHVVLPTDVLDWDAAFDAEKS